MIDKEILSSMSLFQHCNCPAFICLARIFEKTGLTKCLLICLLPLFLY